MSSMAIKILGIMAVMLLNCRKVTKIRNKEEVQWHKDKSYLFFNQFISVHSFKEMNYLTLY